MSNSYPPLNQKQKILLNLLAFLENKEYSRLKIFKIAFLLGREIHFYDFTPYKYGPYSFEMNKDLRMFNKNGWINMDEKSISVNQPVIKSLLVKTEYEKVIREIISKFERLNEKGLLKFVYKNYPFYTQNSLLQKQQKIKKQTAPIAIYTIGYQDLSIDLFIMTLIEKGIKVVLDVRNKPLSYKYGFSYGWLNKYLQEFGIGYLSIPELGIEEKYRKTLSQDRLWKQYSILLKNKKDYLEKASNIIMKQPTVLMCYEKEVEDCHRLRLAKRIQYLNDLPIINFDIKLKQWEKSEYSLR